MKFFHSVAMLNARWLCKLAMVHLLLPQLLCLEFGHLVRNHKAYNLVQSTMCRPIALVFVENKMLQQLCLHPPINQCLLYFPTIHHKSAFFVTISILMTASLKDCLTCANTTNNQKRGQLCIQGVHNNISLVIEVSKMDIIEFNLDEKKGTRLLLCLVFVMLLYIGSKKLFALQMLS